VRRVTIEPTFAAWRETARALLVEGVAPDQVEIFDSKTPQTLTLSFADAAAAPQPVAPGKVFVPKAFLALAQIVARHADPARWQLLYRLLWRLQRARQLLHVEVDNDVAAAWRMEQQVRRDLHKMHAFLRFRQVKDDVGDEHFIAWYQPDHDILELAAPFFQERFPMMQWSILTPRQSVHWDPAARALLWAAGVSREAAPQDDELEEMWRSYYKSIFNPARLNPRAMRSEMPVRYWQNMPELQLLPQLMSQAGGRTETMIASQKAGTAEEYLPATRTLHALRTALPQCKGCELYCHAMHAVFGEGRAMADLMLVGEQPGDEEDKQAKPFVGPAGKVLDRVLDELGFDRSAMYVTNAVKHFKFIERGKRRLHQSPRLSEVTACRPWLIAELQAVQPKVVVALGATAAKSLLGAKFALMKERGRVVASPYAEKVVATIHPSAVLRAMDPQGGEQLYDFLRQDLLLAHRVATGK
jgi:probable DNA metabolism protein